MESVRDLSARLDAFIATHRAQLVAMGLPRRLWPTLWARIESASLGTVPMEPRNNDNDNNNNSSTSATLPLVPPPPTPFSLTFNDATSALEIVADRDLNAVEACVVYAHDWVFASREEALRHLEDPATGEPLRRALSAVLESVEVVEGVPRERAVARGKGVLGAKTLLANLYRLAIQFQITTPASPRGSPRPRATLHCAVTADPFTPILLPFAQNPTFTVAVFIYTPPISSGASSQRRSYTVLFPRSLPRSFDTIASDTEEGNPLVDVIAVPKGTRATRGELTFAPDYSAEAYWQHHYSRAGGSGRAYEWFVPWGAVAGAVKGALAAGYEDDEDGGAVRGEGETPVEGAVVVNVGCGSSRAGEAMLADGTAALVVSVDVAEAAVAGRAASTLEEFLVADVATAATGGLPFRTLSTDTKQQQQPRQRRQYLFDWALDKGTTDGLLYDATGQPTQVAKARRAWAAVSRLTDTIVWISLGQPTSRVLLIEDGVGDGWRVDQCLEVEIPSGAASGMGSGVVGGGGSGPGGAQIDRCWVYVCRRRVSAAATGTGSTSSAGCGGSTV
ncbi:hypothetical protein DFJ73DRAFT_856543, partial [Zopfochytrium polystomum]